MPLPKLYGAKDKTKWEDKPKRSTYVFEKDRQDENRDGRPDGLATHGRHNQGTIGVSIQPKGSPGRRNADENPADSIQQSDAISAKNCEDTKDSDGCATRLKPEHYTNL